MDKEERWDLYINERVHREHKNLDCINPLAEEFVEILKTQCMEFVLDMGCGLGRHMHYLITQGLRVIGCDISSRTLELAEDIAKARGKNLDLVQCDFADMPFNNKVFDAVMAIDSIHHDAKEKIARALREAHRVLKPDGLICLNPISVEDDLFGQGRKLGERLCVIHRIPHYFFDPDEIRSVLERSYFRILTLERDRFKQVRDGKEVTREKFRIIAQKAPRPRGFYRPLPRPLF